MRGDENRQRQQFVRLGREGRQCLLLFSTAIDAVFHTDQGCGCFIYQRIARVRSRKLILMALQATCLAVDLLKQRATAIYPQQAGVGKIILLQGAGFGVDKLKTRHHLFARQVCLRLYFICTGH